jgi:hypothetical protein
MTRGRLAPKPRGARTFVGLQMDELQARRLRAYAAALGKPLGETVRHMLDRCGVRVQVSEAETVDPEANLCETSALRTNPESAAMP